MLGYSTQKTQSVAMHAHIHTNVLKIKCSLYNFLGIVFSEAHKEGGYNIIQYGLTRHDNKEFFMTLILKLSSACVHPKALYAIYDRVALQTVSANSCVFILQTLILSSIYLSRSVHF